MAVMVVVVMVVMMMVIVLDVSIVFVREKIGFWARRVLPF